MPRARYRGTCKSCGLAIKPGDRIECARRAGARGVAWHAACPAPAPEPRPVPSTPSDNLAHMLARAIAPYIECGDAHKQEITINISDSSRVLCDERVHAQFPALMRMVLAQRAVYIYGAPGGGKSHAAGQIARALGVPYTYTSLAPSSMPHEIFGYLRATDGEYVAGVATTWMEGGGILCLDELDNASSSLLVTLNNMLESRSVFIPGRGMVQLPEDAYLIGTGNTAGRGAHPAFPERRPFDMAFATRFAYVQWKYDWTLTRHIVANIAPDKADAIITWCASATEYAESNELPIVIGPRAAIILARLLAVGGIELKDVLEAAVWRGAGEDIIAGLPAFPLG